MLKKVVMGTRARQESILAHSKSVIVARIREAISNAAVGCFNKRQDLLKKVLPKKCLGGPGICKIVVLYFS
jgi:hypothetical protein